MLRVSLRPMFMYGAEIWLVTQQKQEKIATRKRKLRKFWSQRKTWVEEKSKEWVEGNKWLEIISAIDREGLVGWNMQMVMQE